MWLINAPQAHLVPEDQGHHATNELDDEADPEDVHKLKNKIQRFAKRRGGSAVSSEDKHIRSHLSRATRPSSCDDTGCGCSEGKPVFGAHGQEK